MEFEQNLVRVLCIASSETVRGLQWALDRQEFSDRKYQLSSISLSQLQQSGAAEIPKEFDCSLVAIDLGQPVPVENLRKLAHRPGVFAFVHPTPQQLLSVSEMPRWVGIAWDGVGFDRLVKKIDELSEQFQNEFKIESFVDVFRAWEKASANEPDILECTNLPPDSQEAHSVYLDPNLGQILIGDARENVSIKMAPNGVQRPVAELRWVSGGWRFKLLDAAYQNRTQAPEHSLRRGDTIQIGSFSFALKINRNSDRLQQMARRFGVLQSAAAPSTDDTSTQSLAQFCKQLLMSGTRGELRLTSGLRHGTVFFEDGFCVHAITGSVRGQKALMRMWGWDAPKWRFNADKLAEWKSLHLGVAEFDRLHRSWTENWRKVMHLAPPSQLKLRASPDRFLRKHDWDSRECQVMASVCEYTLVRDVLNHCRLDDVTIIETLINMRRLGLVVISS